MSVAASGLEEYARHLLSAQPHTSRPTAAKFAIRTEYEMQGCAILSKSALISCAARQHPARRHLSSQPSIRPPSSSSSFTGLEQTDEAGARRQGARAASPHSYAGTISPGQSTRRSRPLLALMESLRARSVQRFLSSLILLPCTRERERERK